MSLLEYFLSLPRYYSADQMRQSSRMYIQCFTFLSIGGNKRGCRERIAFTRTCSSSSLLLNVRITSETGNATTRTICLHLQLYLTSLSVSLSLSFFVSLSLSLCLSLCVSRYLFLSFSIGGFERKVIQRDKIDLRIH